MLGPSLIECITSNSSVFCLRPTRSSLSSNVYSYDRSERFAHSLTIMMIARIMIKLMITLSLSRELWDLHGPLGELSDVRGLLLLTPSIALSILQSASRQGAYASSFHADLEALWSILACCDQVSNHHFLGWRANGLSPRQGCARHVM